MRPVFPVAVFRKRPRGGFAFAGLKRRFWLPSGFGRNVAMLVTGTALNRMIVLLALPVLTRLYTPDQYGGAAVFAGIVGLVVVGASFRYELAIPLPRRDLAAFNVVAVAMGFVVAVSFLAGFAYLAIRPFWSQQTGLSDGLFLILLIVATSTSGFYNIVNYWAVRKQRFGTISSTRVQQGIASTLTQLVLGLTGIGALGLIIGQIVGLCAGAKRLFNTMRADYRMMPRNRSLSSYGWALKRYRNFPIYNLPAGLLNTASTQAPVLLFSAFFSPAMAGFYALATRVVSTPNGLVGRAISQVLLPRVIADQRQGTGGELVLRLLGTLAWLSFFPFTVVALLAEDIVPIAFGTQWGPAADVVAWTAIWASWQFVCSPLSVTLISLERLRLNAALQGVLFVLRVTAILVGAALNSTEVAIVAFTGASVIAYASYLGAIACVLEMNKIKVLKSLLSPISFAIFTSCLFYLCEYIYKGYGNISIALSFFAWVVVIYRNVLRKEILLR